MKRLIRGTIKYSSVVGLLLGGAFIGSVLFGWHEAGKGSSKQKVRVYRIQDFPEAFVGSSN